MHTYKHNYKESTPSLSLSDSDESYSLRLRMKGFITEYLLITMSKLFFCNFSASITLAPNSLVNESLKHLQFWTWCSFPQCTFLLRSHLFDSVIVTMTWCQPHYTVSMLHCYFINFVSADHGFVGVNRSGNSVLVCERKCGEYRLKIIKQ